MGLIPRRRGVFLTVSLRCVNFGISVEGSSRYVRPAVWGGVVVTETSSYSGRIDSCITQLKAPGPSRACNESKEEEEAVSLRCVNFGISVDGSSRYVRPGVSGFGFRVWSLGLEFGVWGLGFGVWGLGFGVWGFDAGVLG